MYIHILYNMSPANPQTSSTSSTVVTILTMHGTWDQLQICNKGGGTTGPTFYSKKEKNVGLHSTLRNLILW